MDKEKTALLEHAARCRRTADQIHRHRGPAKRLRVMAAEYESQARRLENRTTLDARRPLDLPFLAAAPQRQRRG
jgi:hypothetical protein